MNLPSLGQRRLYTLTTGAAVPAWLLRAGLLGIGILAAVLLTDLALWRGILVLVGLAAACAPRSFSAWVLIVMLGIALLSGPMEVGRIALAMACVHLSQVLGSLTYQIGARGMIQLRALTPTLTRFAVIQVGSQVIGVLVVLGLHPQPGPGLAWFAVLAMVALFGLAAWLYQQLNADFED